MQIQFPRRIRLGFRPWYGLTLRQLAYLVIAGIDIQAGPVDISFLGPAPQRPYNEKRVHYLFRFFWDYSGGQITNWGAHHLDIAQWGLGMDNSGPVAIRGSGTAPANDGCSYNCHPSFEIVYTYGNGTNGADGTQVVCRDAPPKEWPVRDAKGNLASNGILFEGEKDQWIFVSRSPSANHAAIWSRCGARRSGTSPRRPTGAARAAAMTAATCSSVGAGSPRRRPAAMAAATYLATVFRSLPVPRAMARRPSPKQNRRRTSRTSITPSSR